MHVEALRQLGGADHLAQGVFRLLLLECRRTATPAFSHSVLHWRYHDFESSLLSYKKPKSGSTITLALNVTVKLRFLFFVLDTAIGIKIQYCLPSISSDIAAPYVRQDIGG